MRSNQHPAPASNTMPRLVQTPNRVDWLGERISGPCRFKVSIGRADGTSETYYRLGGSSVDHTQEAIGRAGDAGVVGILVIAQSRAA